LGDQELALEPEDAPSLAIKADDIEVVSNGGGLELSASYVVQIPLVANISLYLEFEPSSAQ